MQTILVCDDDKQIVEAIDIYLTGEGFEVIKVYDGYEVLEYLESHDADLLIIDVMMPGLDGIRTTLKVRENSSIPIIILSAKSEDTDKILGLNIGADDYITKPFNPLEVVARVKTQLRRFQRYNPAIGQPQEKNEFDIRGLIINKDSHRCTLFGKELSLTPIEFSLLWYLCEHQGRVVSSEELFEAVWKEKYLNSNNTVMAHIGRLREKMKEPAKNPKFIKTVWGVGYEIE